jgi:hypothetical protein
LKTLVSVMAYHSFSGEVEASNTPTIRRLTLSCRHQLSRITLIATIGGIAAAAIVARNRFMGFLARTETWRYRLGGALEIGGSLAVLGLGIWPLLRRLVI